MTEKAPAGNNLKSCMMNGYRAAVSRRLRLYLQAVLLLVTVIGSVAAAPVDEPGPRLGRAGVALSEQKVNFTELSAKEARVPRVMKTRAMPRKSVPRPMRETNSPAVVVDTEVSAFDSSSDPVLVAASGPVSPSPSASFLALQDNAVSFNPDTQGAVGPNHLMVTLSSEVRIQNRSGGVISTVSLDNFWGSLGGSNVFDPRVLYDSKFQRWIFAAISNPATNNSRVLLAISDNSDPTGNWTRHGVRVDDVDGVYASAPHIGVSRDWITIQANMLDQTGLFYFSSDIFTFNKTNLYAGGAPAFRRFYHFPAGLPAGDPLDAGTPVPMVSFDDTYATNYLVANVGTLAGFGRLRVFSISGPVDNPVYNEYDQSLYVDAGPVFGSPAWENVPLVIDNFAPQASTTNRIFIGDARMQSVVFRNGALWAAHHVYLPTNAPNRVSVQWWCFTPSGLVLQHGRVDDPSSVKNFAYPSIAVNRYEDVLIGYTRFAGNQYPSANYAFHGYQDGPGRLQSDTVLKAGESKFTVADNGLILWGDWSATMVDPLNDTDLWTIQEYASAPVNGVERWGTWWGRVSPPTSLAVRAVESSDPVVAGSEVTYSISITNLSSHIATGVKLTNTLPAGATFVSATVLQGACEHSSGVVVCNLGDVHGEQTSNVVITASIVARLNQAGTATNRVTVFGYANDTSPSDNTAVVTTTVSTAADVALGLTANPNPGILNNNITLALSVTNLGPSTAGTVSLTNILPSGISFVSATASQGSCTHLSGQVTCAFGSLTAGTVVNVSIIGRVIALGAQTNVATVASSALDAAPANNSATIVVRGNTLPTLQAISNRTIAEDGSLGPIAFTINDAETPPNSLILSAESSNPDVVPVENIVFGGSGTSRTITVTPAANANGAITITRFLQDLEGSVVSNSFVLTITAVNDRPIVTDIANQSFDEDSALGPIGFQVGDVETPATSLTLSAASSNTGLIPNANIQLGGSGSNRTVRLFPTTNQSGTATITITVSDGAVTANDTFVVTVNPVNDLPSITDVGNQTIGEDSATSSLSFKVSDAETALTSLVVSGTSSNPTLIPASGIVITGTGATRSVVVRPAANEFGVATVTLTVTDGNNASSSDSFVVNVMGVNDLPTLNSLLSRTIPEDAGVQTVLLTGISGGAANETNALTFTVTSSNPGLIPSPGVFIHTSGTTNSFVFRSATNSSGSATLSVSVNDGGASNNIITRSFGVTVTAVNDPPVVLGLEPRFIDEDGATGALPFTVQDVESSATLLSVSGASSNSDLVPNSNIVFGGSGSNRTVSVTPAPDKAGTATITVFVRDASTTNSASFLLTVNSVNDLPSLSEISNQIIREDTATNLVFSVSDPETPSGALLLTATSSNPSLISSFAFGGSGTNRFVSVLPVTNQSGSATITVSVIDSDGGSNVTSFALSVLPVNDPPSLDPIDDVTVDEDSGVSVVTLAGISSGAPNEAQAVSVSASSLTPGLVTNVSLAFLTESSSRLSFAPVANANGVGRISVSVNDGLTNTTRTFAITIRPVNDLPVISTPSNVEIDEDTTAAVAVTVSDLETPSASLVVQVLSSNPELLDETGVVVDGAGADRVIRLTPLAESSGATVVSLTVLDADSGSATTTFELLVRPVNDAPAIAGLAAMTLNEDSGATVLPFTVSDAESFPSSLQVSVMSQNSDLLPPENLTLGGSGGSRSLTLSPRHDAFGTSVVSVIVREGEGAADLSTTNSFVVSVLPVNDPPTLDPIASMVLPAGAAAQSVALAGIGTGATNEVQSLTVTAVSGNPAVVPHPAVAYVSPSATASIEFAPVTGATGIVEIVVSVTESGGFQNGGTNRAEQRFTVNVSGPGPALLVEHGNQIAIVSWTTNSPLSWRLESTTNVSASASWVPFEGTPSVVGGRFVVTNVLGSVTRFYRLRNQ